MFDQQITADVAGATVQRFEGITPEPLVAPTEAATPYPVDALSPVMCAAVEGYQAYGQQPMALVANAALASASLASQGLVNVRRDQNLVGPISLNLMVIAESGERKTAADERMTRAVRQWEEAKREQLADDVNASRAKREAWKAERDGVMNKIKSASGGGVEKQQDVEDLKNRLIELEKSPPAMIYAPRLFTEDNTPEAMAKGLSEGWPSSSLWSDEGGLVVGSHGLTENSAMRYFGLLNRMWDGGRYERQRATTESFVIKGRRLTANLMMQGLVLSQLLEAGGGAGRGTGFLARFLIAWPSSTMGTRLYREGDLDSYALANFDARLHEVLDYPLPTIGDNMELEPAELPLSIDARNSWVRYHNDVERELGRGGEYFDTKDVAAKSAENAARLAGVMHVMENGPHGEISDQTFTNAACLAAWYLREGQRVLGSYHVPTGVTDAQELLAWMQRQPGGIIKHADIARYCPGRLRGRENRQAREEALRLLLETHHIFEVSGIAKLGYELNLKIRI
jgi:hypothetical protein